MIAIKSIIQEIILATILGKKILTPRKSKIEVALIVFSILFFGVGIFFLSLSFNQYLQISYTPTQAAIMVAILSLILAIISWLMAWRLHTKNKLDINTMPTNIAQNIKQTLQDVYQEFEAPVREHPKTALLIATAIGFLVVNQIRRF